MAVQRTTVKEKIIVGMFHFRMFLFQEVVFFKSLYENKIGRKDVIHDI